jgi:hypothetical protein
VEDDVADRHHLALDLARERDRVGEVGLHVGERLELDERVVSRRELEQLDQVLPGPRALVEILDPAADLGVRRVRGEHDPAAGVGDHAAQLDPAGAVHVLRLVVEREVDPTALERPRLVPQQARTTFDEHVQLCARSACDARRTRVPGHRKRRMRAILRSNVFPFSR